MYGLRAGGRSRTRGQSVGKEGEVWIIWKEGSFKGSMVGCRNIGQGLSLGQEGKV